LVADLDPGVLRAVLLRSERHGHLRLAPVGHRDDPDHPAGNGALFGGLRGDALDVGCAGPSPGDPHGTRAAYGGARPEDEGEIILGLVEGNAVELDADGSGPAGACGPTQRPDGDQAVQPGDDEQDEKSGPDPFRGPLPALERLVLFDVQAHAHLRARRPDWSDAATRRPGPGRDRTTGSRRRTLLAGG